MITCLEKERLHKATQIKTRKNWLYVIYKGLKSREYYKQVSRTSMIEDVS